MECAALLVLLLLFYSLDYTEPHVFSGKQKHTLVSDMWSLGIVAHFALFGTNPLYQLEKERDFSEFMPRILMKKRNWEQLGPILQSELLKVVFNN